tara:strand:- start:10463 stop:11131 length:669 start_codon:yes stop_codon:yes gene_type:complete
VNQDGGLHADSPIIPRAPARATSLERLIFITTISILSVVIVAETAFLLATYPPDPVIAFVQFDDSDNQIITVKPKALSKTDRAVLIEKYLIQYVRNRETIDHTTDLRRADWLALFTDSAWYANWKETNYPENKNSPAASYARAGLSREIRNITVTPIPDVPSTYQAEFVAVDRKGTETVKERRWLVSIKAVTQPITGDNPAINANPIGLTVYQYILRESASQ